MLVAGSNAIAQTDTSVDPTYRLGHEFFAKQGFELRSNNASPFPLKRNAKGLWSIETESLYVLDQPSKSYGLRPTSATDAPHKAIQQRLWGLYEQHEYQRGFDEAISFMRAMHAQGIGLRLHYRREYESPYANILMEDYWLDLVLVRSEHGRLSRVSIPLHLPKVSHINPRSALSL
ncbi:MAG: hypothetical protein JJU03_09310 [Idiomarina sp.]|nr:hypothetical protein [Idiomarina sp.]